MARIGLIIHGKVKDRHSIVAACKATLEPTHHLLPLFTEQAGDAYRLCRQALQQACTHIICAGGDGTLHECVNALMETTPSLPTDQQHRLRMGILPRGTGNDFVKTIPGLQRISSLGRIIEADHHRTLDLGHLVFHSNSGQRESSYFINIADVGIGARVVGLRTKWADRFGIHIGYSAAALAALLSYRPQGIRLRSESQEWEGPVTGLIMANGRFFGGGLCVAPHARADDGTLALVIAQGISWKDYLKNLGALRGCRPIDHPGMRYASFQRLRLEALEGPIPVEADGEPLGFLPLEASVSQAALRWLHDPESPATLGKNQP